MYDIFIFICNITKELNYPVREFFNIVFLIFYLFKTADNVILVGDKLKIQITNK